MTKNILTYNFKSIPIEKIDLDDQLTSFSLDAPTNTLQQSIKEFGLIHPVTLVPVSDRFRIVCGHCRVKISSLLNLNEIPARILDPAISDESMLMLNLSENLMHHNYSDIETGLILSKLLKVKVPKNRITEKYMPMLNLERSKKLLGDYPNVTHLTFGLQKLLHETNVPMRIFSVLFRWDTASTDAAESFFSVLRPGINKWRDILEWVDEIATRDEIAPSDIFELTELKSAFNQNDLAPNDRYDQIRQVLHSRRFPILNDMKIRLAKALDKLKLDDKTKVHVQDSFESDEIRIEMKFRTREQFVSQLEKLVRASDSEALNELIRIFKNS